MSWAIDASLAMMNALMVLILDFKDLILILPNKVVVVIDGD